MPLRRKYAPRRKLIRRLQRRRIAKYAGLYRGGRRAGPLPVYHFKRTQFYQNALSVSAAGTDYAQAWTFALNLLPNATDFTNLYDMYMIKKVVWKLIPKITQDTLVAGTANQDLPQVHTAIDYDDTVPPASIQTLCEYQSHRMTRGNQVHTRVFVPKIEMGAEGAAGSALIAPKAFQWIDSDNASAVHKGLKVYIPKPLTALTQINYDVQVVYYFSCKDVN